MKEENKIEKEKATAIHNCNVSCNHYSVQHNDSNGRTAG